MTARRRFALITAKNSADLTDSEHGESLTVFGNLISQSPSNTDGVMLNIRTDATPNFDAGIQGIADNWRREWNTLMVLRIRIAETSGNRVFIGLTDQTLATMVSLVAGLIHTQAVIDAYRAAVAAAAP